MEGRLRSTFFQQSEEPSKDCELEQGTLFSETTEVCLRINPAAVLSREGRDRTQAVRDPGTDAVWAGSSEGPGRPGRVWLTIR